jgi:hypothetical protein
MLSVTNTATESGLTPVFHGAFRSREGCLTCRRRRVKCDEGKPACAKCSVKSRQVCDGSCRILIIQCIWQYGVSAVPTLKRAHQNEVASCPRTTRTVEDTHTTESSEAPANDQDWSLDQLLKTFAQEQSSPPSVIPLKRARYYIPPDFLPETPLLEHYKIVLSTHHVDYLFAPSRKAQMMADP